MVLWMFMNFSIALFTSGSLIKLIRIAINLKLKLSELKSRPDGTHRRLSVNRTFERLKDSKLLFCLISKC